MTGEYDDILHHPRHISNRRRRMPPEDRAAQFAPFAALTGYEDAIEETGRLTDTMVCQEESLREILDQKQLLFLGMAAGHPRLRVTHFVPDARKAGGHYTVTEGILKQADPSEGVLIFTDGKRISLEHILELDMIEASPNL